MDVDAKVGKNWTLINSPGFVAMQAVKAVTQATVKQFAQDALTADQIVHTDALKALTVLAKEHHHIAKVTPPEQAAEWLPSVHVVISNFKSLLLGTYHQSRTGTSNPNMC